MLDVCEEDAVRLAVNAALSKWPRAEDAWGMVIWVLARDRLAGDPLNGPLRSFVFPGARSIGMPSIDVIFVVEAERVVIKDVSFYDSPHAKAGHA